MSLLKNDAHISYTQEAHSPSQTEDGSITYYSHRYDEAFHTRAGARSEARMKFITPALLMTGRITAPAIRILDVGFGLGYNAFETIATARRENPHVRIHIDSLEHDKDVPPLACALHEASDDEAVRAIANALQTQHAHTYENVSFTLHLGDARESIHACEGAYDAVYADGFSTMKNPELWTYDFFTALYAQLAEHGTLTTYSSANPVISALTAAGFHVYETEPFGRKTGGTIATRIPTDRYRPRNPLKERERTETTGRIFFRDPTLSRSGEEIVDAYNKERARYLAGGGRTISAWKRDVFGKRSRADERA